LHTSTDQNPISIESSKHQQSAILFADAKLDVPSEGEKMARRRYQNPEPTKVGNWWYLLYWVDEFKNGRRSRRRKRVKLAPASVGTREVKKLRDEHLRDLNQGFTPAVGPATTLSEYIRDVYRPAIMPTMAKSTQDRYESVVSKHLTPALGEASLAEMNPLSLQRYLSSMTRSKLSHESLDKIRDVLSSILGSAVKFRYLVKNPAEGLKLPPAKKGNRTKPFITPEQFNGLLAQMSEPYSTMIYVAVHTGFRASELIGLRWEDIHSDSITIDERCCRGDWGAPKSHASNATIPVNRSVIERIHRLKLLTVDVKAGKGTRRYRIVKTCGPQDLVFQSVQKGAPMRDNNILVRHLKPVARKMGLPWVKWQVLRRSLATWLKLAGADPKDAQALMRHSRVTTTLEIYQQFIPESQRRAVEQLSVLTSGMVN
jgi:integrase